MTQVRVDIRKLADEMTAVLARAEAGDEILVEQDGKVVGEFKPRPPSKGIERGDLRGFLDAL